MTTWLIEHGLLVGGVALQALGLWLAREAFR